jgi:predicted metal-dependent phosphoesterase TrpH
LTITSYPERDVRGSKYRKTDLQVHTPASRCYEENGVTPEKIVDRAIQQGLEIIAITDHNTTSFVDRVCDAAKGKSLHVFPGVEITSAGGHVLAIFERDRSLKEIDDLLARVGILADMRGKKDAIGKDAETVVQEIHALGGIAIAAHANSTNGILKNPQGQLRIKLCSMPEMSALEFTSRDDVEKFSNGLVPGYPKKACVQGSDAHQLAQIGRRFTYLKMDIVALNGIAQALLDHEVKVKFAWDSIAINTPRITTLTLSRGFFSGTSFAFHPHLNCLVGGKGTGKSTVIELLRYCFDDIAPFDDIREDTLGKALSLVGEGATVRVECVDEFGHEFSIEREVSENHDAQVVCRDSAGEVSGLPFRPLFFSQGEIVRVASSKLAQMSLIDAYLDVSEFNDAESSAIAQLEKNAMDRAQVEEKLTKLESELMDPKTGMKVTTADVKNFEQALKEPILKEFPKWEGGKRFVDGRLSSLDRVANAMDEAINAVDIDDLFDVALPRDTPEATALEGLDKLPDDAAELLKQVAATLHQAMKDLKSRAQKQAKQWESEYSKRRKQYEQVVAATVEKSVAALDNKLRKAKRHLETLTKAEKDLERLRSKVASLKTARAAAVADLRTARRARFERRDEVAKRWEQQLRGKVRVVITHLGGRDEYARFLKELLKGSYVHDKDVRSLVSGLDPWTLGELVQARDESRLAGVGIPPETAKKVAEFLSQKPQELLALDSVELRDQPEITFEVQPASFKPLNALSVGGKGTVVMLLAMVEGNAPLLIDQPEDSLDTLFIYEQIVKKVRDQKELRQFVFATHNPNVLVSADADLSFVLEATADAGTVRSHGGIDRKDTNELLVLHLEGGDTAFKVRGMKYRRA